MRINPDDTGSAQLHRGIDIANSAGTPIYAVAEGVIVQTARNHPVAGNFVVVAHKNRWHSTYTHLSKIQVSQGYLVHQGDRLGLMGAIGRATGPHLHFELSFDGAPQNPLDYFWQDRQKLRQP